jgi:carbon storage regulator CsrA
VSNFTRESGKSSKIGGLVFTRGIGESVTVNGGELIVEVVDIKGKNVRLAFKAAREVKIHRSEINFTSPSPSPSGEKKP